MDDGRKLLQLILGTASKSKMNFWSIFFHCSNYFHVILKIIKFKCWHARLAAVQMLQNFGIFNSFLANDHMKSIIKEIILNSLVDEQLEVRLAACLTLTGFLHSGFLVVDQQLIVNKGTRIL
jgi:hypothetical protein